jgi:hypothetical protein
MTTPPALLEKLNPDGTYQPYAGNTIICHIAPESAAFAALTDVHAQLSQRSFSAKLSRLPTSSYHMTLFGGANDKHRRPGNWPEGVAFDTPIADCHKELARRLDGFDLECDLPFRMKVSAEGVREKEMALRLELEPVDEAENQKLRRLRDRLSVLLGIKVPGHETYGFHISLAYVIDWLNPDELKDYRSSYAEWRDMVALHSPVIELGRPEFCTFKNMLRFDRQFYLGA